MKHVNTAEFDALIADGKTVLLDFFATWCGPCKMLTPVLEQVEGDYPDVEFVKVDVDEEPDLARRYGISVIPTLFVIKNGEPTATTKGYLNADELRAFIDGGL